MPLTIDDSFLSEQEGGRQTVGDVPAATKSKSGVTIATGFDLGQRSEADLKALALDAALISKLRPYCGATRKSAQALLKTKPLVITAAEAAAIDQASMLSHLRQVERKYNTTLGNSARFADLPAQAQTVIASVAMQYGPGLDSATPRFWKAVTTQDWREAISELRAFNDAYPTRRRREAELLAQIYRGAANAVEFDQPHWRVIAQGFRTESWYADGQAVGTGGILAPQPTRLPAHAYYYRFASSTSSRSAQLGGGWWLDFEAFRTVSQFATDHGYRLKDAARLLLALPYDWTKVDLLVKALLRVPMRAYTGVGKPAQGGKGGADAGTRWIPSQRVQVRQLYIPGLFVIGRARQLYEEVFEQPPVVNALR